MPEKFARARFVWAKKLLTNCRIDPKFGKLKAEELVDERIVRKLEKEGVFR